jgi:cation:H+ antiporter
VAGGLVGLLLLGAGIFALERGSDQFVESAAALARRAGWSLTIVGLLTVGVEWEELAVVLIALAEGSPRLAFGAMIGAAIANLTVVLAAGIWFHPIVAGRIERRLAPLVAAATGLVALLSVRGELDRPAGGLLLAAFGLYVVWLVLQLRAGVAPPEYGADDEDDASAPRLALLTLVGLALALAGGELMVRGALRLADGVGLSETAAGLTLVAIGTSVPDAAISLAAARRRAAALVVANVAGSNLCNLLLLLGLVALVEPIVVPASVIDFDIPVLVTVTGLFVWVLSRRGAGRGVAVALSVIYALYLLSHAL